MRTIQKTLIWLGYLIALTAIVTWFLVPALHLLFVAIGGCLLAKSLETDKIREEMLK